MDKYGLDEGGQTHRFLMLNVMRRMDKYMPYQSGVLRGGMIRATDPDSDQIVIPGPYARYLYYGKVMVNEKTGKGPGVIPFVGPRYRKGTILKPTDRDLNFDKSKNPQAGPFWDKALIAAEGEVIAREVESYAKYIAGRNND